MKETGMTRRVDELGRIVIPKEIRATLKITVGTPMEIFLRDGDLVLRKLRVPDSYADLAYKTADALAKVTGHTVLFADGEKVTAAGGRRGSEMLNRVCHVAASEPSLLPSDMVLPGVSGMTAYVCPFLLGEQEGAVVLLAEGEITPADRQAARLACGLFAAAVS